LSNINGNATVLKLKKSDLNKALDLTKPNLLRGLGGMFSYKKLQLEQLTSNVY
jgi:hypothetical protein